ncbi:MurR/RpiR family transcriptional regulator [Clostridium phoceensis]|jgi:DNA-binding MurR/RpiR family transcriptional regulator|uniref:MurR/RpiR family transcriptional regulator n=1 Tax=Clostridium phoceensis TaxID=1650661 RepID=UPI00067F29A8|nr:MurR/RpiR family transcriptional regulator [Clostridium phoceensis]MBS5505480.1 MurR/RpiR family transcriptional regulator [Oscillospiraceae bacterium]GBF68170.1 transcriptional regulator RpiR family [Lawsonibacter asaccharolyticus]
MSSLVTKIGKQVNQMTKSQKKVANYLLFNMDKLLFFTADELAKAANVSTATVVRFARELDFEGYTDMQKAARLRFHDREEEPEDLPQSSPEEDSSEYLLEKSFRQDIQNLKRTFQDLSREDLERACTLLKTSRRVYLVGMRISRSMATYAYINWGMLRKGVHLIHNEGLDYAEELIEINSEDLIVAFWAPRYNRATYQMLSHAKRQKASVLLITNREFNLTMEEGDFDVILRCCMENSSYQSSFVAPVTLVNYLTRQLELEFSKDIAARLANWDSLLGDDFFMI